MAGIIVNLLDGLGNWLAATTTGTTGGLYQFTGLAAGSYQLRFDATGYTFSPRFQGSTNTDNDADEFGYTYIFSLTDGETKDDIDAGLFFTSVGTGSGGSGGLINP